MKSIKSIMAAMLILFSAVSKAQQIYLADNGLTASGSGTSKIVSLGGTLNNAATSIDFGSGNSSSNFLFKKGSANYFFIGNDGNIGMGTITPGIKLQVDGHIASTFGSSGFVQLWNDNAIIWKYGNGNGRLRFGSATDLSAGSWAERMCITDAGNVGIGIANPAAKLELPNAGNASFRVGITGNRANTHTQLINSLAVIADNNSSTAVNGAVAWDFFNNGSSPSWAGTLLEHSGTAVAGNLYGVPAANQGILVFNNVSNGVIASNGANIFISPLGNVSTTFLTNGNVGIGTTTPQSKLAVNGDVYAKKIRVTQIGWPDYVFRNEYKLPSLAQIEQYIQQHKHLPEVPSGEEVEKNGLDLGDNQATLLKKIEELTLYLIEQNKKIEEQQKRIESLEKERSNKK